MKSTSASPAIIALIAGIFLLRFVNSPLVLAALILAPLALIYILGPIAIYCCVRSSSKPRMEPVQPADPSVPADQSETMLEQIQALHELGFVPVGNWFRSSEDNHRDSAVAAVLQHQGSTDIATVIAMKNNGALVGFSRARSNGSRIRTSASTLRNALPPNEQDSVVRVKGRCDAGYLWMLHRARVAKDRMAAQNAPLVNAFAHQMHQEIDSLKHHLTTGYFTATPDGAQIRPTALGAVMMTLRMAAPTAYVGDWSDRLTLQDTLNKLRLPTPAEYKREQNASREPQEEVMHVPPGTRTAMA